MLWFLVKKQFSEVFRSYFYDAKKNKMRSKGAVVGWFVFFFVVMIGILGGMFTFLSLTLCPALTEVEMGWLYFLILSSIAILFGAFGSVFNTYSSLYLAKDNDLLLSLPIPLRQIIASRIINVYLMGTMYSATVLIPALIVYWVTVGITFSRLVCGLLLFVIVTVFILLLSCVLGWVVAKISVRLKNRSFVTVFIALLFVAAYYFFYFKANDLIQDIIRNADLYGNRIKGAAYGLYLFGRIGEGDWAATGIFLLATALLAALVWIVLSRSFLGIATSGGNTKKTRYVEKRAREKGVFGALLSKEFARFTSSPNYMLNCGLGIILIPLLIVLLVLKGKEICEMLNLIFADLPDASAVLVCAVLCMLAAMNDMAAPSVSLEGKSLWIPQSLPLLAKTALRAKASVQLILTEIPLLPTCVCAALIVPVSIPARLMICLTPMVYAAFLAFYGTAIGVKMPLLNWTTEIAPIKQSGAVTLVLLSAWGYSIALGGLYFLIGPLLGTVIYLGIWTLLFAAAAILLIRWLDTKGSRIFSEL